MTREEAKAYFEDCNDAIVTACKEQNIYDYEKQEIKGVHTKRVYEANTWAISALSENKGEWIPVSERLPEEGELVLCSVKDELDGKRYVIINSFNKEPFWTNGTITAWQPLPEPYKAEKGGEGE